MECNNLGKRYGRLCTTQGHYISSSWIKRNSITTRNNYCVQIFQTKDKYSHCLNAPPEYYYEKLYREIEYFFLHKFQNRENMLAYIKVCNKIIKNEQLDFEYFTKFKTHEFIDIQIIDHCVGFLKLRNQYFIIDRDNEVNDGEFENI
ncbi:hypothetical protein Glove_607g3 [Diversispora epigaea]|uniref:Uncharacterized protein n=1 Tax=Diversispora epigaea TaxID=1348612 RepID=A0A397GBA6_9GLOM|nr:hypothetical protein Glove_607g3 [Diversispora epigaea]